MIKDNIIELIKFVLDFLKVRLTNGELRFSLIRFFQLSVTVCILSFICLTFTQIREIRSEAMSTRSDILALIQTNLVSRADLITAKKESDFEIKTAKWEVEENLKSAKEKIEVRLQNTENEIGNLQNDVRSIWNGHIKSPRQLGEVENTNSVFASSKK